MPSPPRNPDRRRACDAVSHGDSQCELLIVNQAAIADQPNQTPRRIGASAETENVNFIAIGILLGQKFVAVNDVFLQPRTDGATDIPVVPFGADALVIPLCLLNTAWSCFFHRFEKSAHVGFHLIGCREILIRRFVPGAIET